MKIRFSSVLLFDRWCKVYGFLVLFQTGSNCHRPLQGVYKFAFLMSEFWSFGSNTEFSKTSVTELYLTHHMWSPHDWSKVVVPDG